MKKPILNIIVLVYIVYCQDVDQATEFTTEIRTLESTENGSTEVTNKETTETDITTPGNILEDDNYSTTKDIVETTVSTATITEPDSSLTSTISQFTTSISTSTSPPSVNTTISCAENEVYSCLPFCIKTCHNFISKLICVPVPLRIGKWCKKECHCQRGYLKDKSSGKCVESCPSRQHGNGILVNAQVGI